MRNLTLGSLFDGSGGFPLAGLLAGIVPVWKSEIEPFPIAVTEKRLPFVKHLGDINSINGAEIEPVDIITFGSPCTDLTPVYWWGMSAQLKLIIDKCYCRGLQLKNKKVGTIVGRSVLISRNTSMLYTNIQLICRCISSTMQWAMCTQTRFTKA